MSKFQNGEKESHKMSEEEKQNMIESSALLGRIGAAIFQSVLKETDNVEIAARITRIYLETLIKPNSHTFFL